MIRRYISILSALLLVGCGGSGEGPSNDAPEPYAGFGYTNVLYRGTLTATNARGETVSGATAATAPPSGTLSPNGQIVTGIGLVPPSAEEPDTWKNFELHIRKDGPDTLRARFSDSLEFEGTGKLVERSRNLRATFVSSDSAVKGTLVATVDDPDMTPTTPPVGTYEGMAFAREPVSGELIFSRPASGRFEADGSFTLKNQSHLTSGELRGKIVDAGNADDIVTIQSFNVVHLMDPLVRAYGTANDLTVVQRSTGYQTEIYRLVRTGG